MAHGNSSEMRHNGLRKRLDVLGFTQPLPLGAVPLVGALLEDLIQTTESLKQHKDQVHNLLQEKSAWELGVEAYKCDNSKLLAEVSKLNRQIIHQNDQYLGKKCEFSKRIRNLEMDKRYLEDHLQQMGERFEELEGKYQDVLDPRRKAMRKPFVSTVKSGCFIPPEMPGGGGVGGVHNPHSNHVCPSRCPASVRRKDVEVERDRLQQETVSMQDSIDMQSKQIEVRDREIDRINGLLCAGGRPVKALAHDCCYRNVKQLHEDVNHLQHENSLLKGKLVNCEKHPSKEQGTEATSTMPAEQGCVHHNAQRPCDARVTACKNAVKTCEEAHRELREKERVINELQCELHRCRSEEKNVDVMNKLSTSLADRVKLQDSYVDMLSKQQKVLKEANKFGSRKSNCENEPLRQCKKADGKGDVDMSNIQREIECLRQQLADMSVFNQRQDCVRQLQSELALKDCEISKLKNKSCLSGSSGANRSWKDDCETASAEKMCLEREHCIMKEELRRLHVERDHLKMRLDTEMDKFSIEREALNNTLDTLKGRLEKVERDNRDLLAKQEPKNAAIMEMQSDVKHLRCQIDILREDNQKLQYKVNEMKKENCHKDQMLEKSNQQVLDLDMKLKQSNRKLSEKGCEESKLFEDINRVNGELRKCRENYSCLESQNARISAELHERVEEAQRFQCDVEGFKQDQNRVVQEYESMKKKYTEQLQTINCLQSQTREMSIEIDTYNCQIESLRQELECTTTDNKKLADQLAGVECEFSNTKRLLTDSQMRNDELQSKMKEYMLEVNRVGKLLEEKEKERDEMVDNLKKLSDCTSRLRSNNISMGAELCRHKHDLEEANKSICDLNKSLVCKDGEMARLREEANKSLEEVCKMRAELDKCSETQRKLHEESTELRNTRQKMIMSTERLKNELETWKTLHDEMKSRNEKLKRELKAIQCEDHPNNVKALQEMLAQSREDMDAHVHKIASLSSQLAETKEQLCKFKQDVEEEKCRANPVKKYVDQCSELEKHSSRFEKCCENLHKPRQVIFTPAACEGDAKLRNNPCSKQVQKCGCGGALQLNSKDVVIKSPRAQIVGAGMLTVKKKCAVHPVQREVVPIVRSRSHNAQQNHCAMPTHRHHSCSPPRPTNLSQKATHLDCHKVDSCFGLEKMCAEMNMSGLVDTPAPPPPPPPKTNACAKRHVSATQVAMDAKARASTKRLLDDVRNHGQAKRQWTSTDEIEQIIKSQKNCAVENAKATCASKCPIAPPPTVEPPAVPKPTLTAPCKVAQNPGSCHREAPVASKRTDIPKMSLVASFIPKEQPQACRVEPANGDKVKSQTGTSALEKGFNTVVAELKQITHTMFGKPEDAEPATAVECSNEGAVVPDSVKQRIQRFQRIVNNTSRNDPNPRPTALVRPSQSAIPDERAIPEVENDDEAGKDDGKPQQGIIRRVIETISQGGIQGLSTLHKEDDDATKNRKALEKKAVEHEKSELLSYNPADLKETDPNLQCRIQSENPIDRSNTPRRSQAPPGKIPLPSVPIIGSSGGESGSEAAAVIDLTESLRGGNESSVKSSEPQSSPADSEVEYIAEPDPNPIHTVSSATRQGVSQRSSIPEVEGRFQTMIHTEPSIMRHEEYNKFAKQGMSNATLSSTCSEDQEETVRSSKPVNNLHNNRRRAVLFRKRGPMESTPFRDLLRREEAVQQDDGCVATSSGNESGDDRRFANGGFDKAVNACTSPIHRGGRSISDLSARNSPKLLPAAYQHQFVNHLRGHDSGPSVPFSELLLRGGDDDASSMQNSFYLDQLISASEKNSLMQGRGRRFFGLAGGGEDQEDESDVNEYYMNQARIQNGSEDSNSMSDRWGPSPYQVTSESKSGTPQSFKGPYYGTGYNADDNLKSLNIQMSEMIAQERSNFSKMGSAKYNNCHKRGKDLLMSKFVNQSGLINPQSKYLDGLQSTNDEMSVSGTSTGSRPMQFFCSISKSMDDSNDELNVNIMLLGNEGEEEDIGSRSVSCMSESTQQTHATKITVDGVYLSYSQPELTDTWLLSLMDNEEQFDGSAGEEESLFTTLLDSKVGTSNEREISDAALTRFLDNILLSNELLSTSDERSLASASAPALPTDLSARE